MLLERIDIDQQGPLHRVQLGPFSHKLNAIYGPSGSGKSTVLRFLRDTLLGDRSPADRHSPNFYHNVSLGRVVWAGRDGLLHCVRESDGRVSLDFESRDGRPVRAGQAYNHSLSHLTPTVIDGIITSSQDISVSQAIAAAVRAGLDHATTAASQTGYDPHHEQRESLQRRIVELDRLLADTPVASESLERLTQHHATLTAELARLDRDHALAEQRRISEAQRRSMLQREADVESNLQRLRDQEGELRRMLAEVDAELRATSLYTTADQTRYAIAETHRRQLQDLDSQLIRWRRTLRDIRQLRSRLDAGVPDVTPLSMPTAEYDSYRNHGSTDEWSTRDDSLYSLESRLEATQREIDWLASRYDAEQASDPLEGYSVSEVSELSSGLQRLKTQLQQINARLFEPSSLDYPPTDRAYLYGETRTDLLRCEAELLHSIEHLIRHRNDMLKRIAIQHNVPIDQILSAFGDWRQCQDHPHLYDWLLSEGCPPQLTDRRAHAARVSRLESDRADYSHELDRTVNHLENAVAELRRLRAERLALPVFDAPLQTRRREDVVRERNSVSETINRFRLHSQYSREREDCVRRLASLQRPVATVSTLASRASYWLQRLSSGRLRSITWQTSAVQVDGLSENQLVTEDRYIAALAVRMAAVDELTRRGHGVPLLIEIPSVLETYRGNHVRSGGYPYDGYRFDGAPYPSSHGVTDYRYSVDGYLPSQAMPRWLDTVLAFADAGHQTLLLTRDREAVDRVAAAGGTVLSLPPVAVPTRQVYAYRSPVVSPPMPTAPIVHRSTLPVRDLNADLDMAWREAYGFYDNPDFRSVLQPPAIYRGPLRDDYRDTHGIHSFDSPGQRYHPANPPLHHVDAGHREVASSPFFLTADSPVDQAPSVDAVAGARLRGVGVSRIGQLLVAEPGRLADALGIANVTEACVRRWQNEARLVCRVPQLRAFDARVLVGCGIADPKQLASMHPGELLDKVESFLATERGRQILRSGSSYELSRITSWIAAANRSVSREDRHGVRMSRRSERDSSPRRSSSASAASSVERTARPRTATEPTSSVRSRYDADGYDRDGFDRSGYGRDGYNRSGYNRSGYNRNGFDRGGYNRDGYNQDGYNREGRNRSGQRRSHSHRTPRESAYTNSTTTDRAEREPRAERESRSRRSERSSAGDYGSQRRDVVSMDATESSRQSDARGWRFYLERKSPIVDAPTIGPRTAHKLEKLGLYTVDDLLNADPEAIAEQLGNRRITAEDVLAWQQQASLVCRIPMLRGHDAQLLVAAGIHEPEQVSQSEAKWLLTQIDAVVESSEGKRILRGSEPPDLQEIQEWIEYAGHHRELRAA